MTVIIFIVVLAVLIFVHELGHFLFARMCGIRVDAFALGFGPKLFSWKKGETTYSLNLIPFGGYVKIFGENPDLPAMPAHAGQAGDNNVDGPDKGRSFVHKKKWQQVIVLVAGILFNFIFAALLYIVVFASGITASMSSFVGYQTHFNNPRIMVTYVTPGSPADKAGLKNGDIISHVSSGEHTVSIIDAKVQGVTDAQPANDASVLAIQDRINSTKGKDLNFTYVRNNESHSVDMAPVAGLVTGRYAIGISMDAVGDLRLPFFSAIKQGTIYTGNMISATAVGLYIFAVNIFHGAANFSDVAGPIGIAGIVGDAAHLGFVYLLMITALISINLGVINLVPFPALDGGRTLFVIVEAIIRRRIPAKFTNTVNMLGFGLLMLLMIIVTYKDIVKLFK